MRTKMARFPFLKTLADFDFGFQFGSTGKVHGQWSDWRGYTIDNGAGIPIGFEVAGKSVWVSGNEAATYVGTFQWPDPGQYWHINYP